MAELLLVVKNGHAAELLRRALQGVTTPNTVDVRPVGAALAGRRYDRAVVLSLPDDHGSAAERETHAMWVKHIETKLPPGVMTEMAY